jgi:S1-C subfamily serine protease
MDGPKFGFADNDLKHALALSTLQRVYVLGEGKVTDKALGRLRAACPRAIIIRKSEVTLGILINIRAAGPFEVEIARVEPDSPAERAGFQSGDTLVKFAGEPTPKFEDLLRVMLPLKQGQRVDAELLRDGQTVDVTVEFPESEKPPKP